MLKYFFGLLYIAITYKNPCKKCLVRACCSEKCEPVITFENFYWEHDQHNFQRFVALTMIIAVFGFILKIVTLIIR